MGPQTLYTLVFRSKDFSGFPKNMPLLCLKKCFVLFFEKKKKRDGERRSSRLVPVSEKALHFVLRAKLRLRNVTGTSGTAILRLGHVQKFCQKF